MKLSLTVLIGALLSGCINVTASLQPENANVPEIREASDCVPIIFGFSYGTATLVNALAEEVTLINNYQVPKQKIQKVRRVQLHDYQFLFFGARCVEVVGE